MKYIIVKIIFILEILKDNLFSKTGLAKESFNSEGLVIILFFFESSKIVNGFIILGKKFGFFSFHLNYFSFLFVLFIKINFF